MFRNLLSATVAAAIVTGAAAAETNSCAMTDGHIGIIGPEIPATRTVADAAMACGSALDVTATADLMLDYETVAVDTLSFDPTKYTAAMVANGSLIRLMNADLIRPLDSLIAQYGEDLPARQFITIDGKVMAIAFMADAQHLVYRAELLDQLSLDVPRSYQDLLSTAEALRTAGVMDRPIGGSFGAGWDIGTQFVNIYLGAGGSLFKKGTAQPTINNPTGMAALDMIAEVTAYMAPDHLSLNADEAITAWQDGETAMMMVWGSRVAEIMQDDTALAGPLTFGEDDLPAATLWWNGWSIAKNISDADAETTFQALAHATSPLLLDDDTMPQAVWLMDGFAPQPVHNGVLAAVAAGTTPYPMHPFMGLLHNAAGDTIPQFLRGELDASETLAEIEATYVQAATQAGFLK